MIESHLGHHSDMDIAAVTDDEMNWPHSGSGVGFSPRDRRPRAETEDNLSRLLDRRQRLEVF